VFYLSETLTEISVVAGPASIDLANNIAKRLEAQLTVASLRIFSDGESNIKLGKVGKNCVIVQSTYPPVDTHLIQTTVRRIYVQSFLTFVTLARIRLFSKVRW
jgi:ribose-phosphate pyrophosphokinase